MTSAKPDIALRRLPVAHLTRDSFAPYGAIFGPEATDSPNFNRAPANLGFLWIQRAVEFPGQAYAGTLRYYYRATRCEFLQKHPASTILLVPMSAQPSIIFVAPDDSDGLPNLADAKAFLLIQGSGIILNPGTWIRYAFPLGPWADFAYITQRVDPAIANTTDDIIHCRLPDTFGVVLDIDFTPPPGAQLGEGGAVTLGPPRNPPYE